jgi:hypothetical protein
MAWHASTPHPRKDFSRSQRARQQELLLCCANFLPCTLTVGVVPSTKSTVMLPIISKSGLQQQQTCTFQHDD